MSLLDKYENKKRRKYNLTEEQKKTRDLKMNKDSEKLKVVVKEVVKEEEVKEEEETKEHKELREKEEKEIRDLLKKCIMEDNKKAEEIRRDLNKKPELFQNLNKTFIFDTMKEIFEEKIKNQNKIEIQQVNFLL